MPFTIEIQGKAYSSEKWFNRHAKKGCPDCSGKGLLFSGILIATVRLSLPATRASQRTKKHRKCRSDGMRVKHLVQNRAGHTTSSFSYLRFIELMVIWVIWNDHSVLLCIVKTVNNYKHFKIWVIMSKNDDLKGILKVKYL